MPPAMPTFRLSISPGMGMATGRHVRSAVSDRPCPSLPSTRHTPAALETATSASTASGAVGSAQYRTRPRDVVNVTSSSHVSRARGRRNTPPRAARSACERNGASVRDAEVFERESENFFFRNRTDVLPRLLVRLRDRGGRAQRVRGGGLARERIARTSRLRAASGQPGGVTIAVRRREKKKPKEAERSFFTRTSRQSTVDGRRASASSA